jgi:hypothetical protein
MVRRAAKNGRNIISKETFHYKPGERRDVGHPKRDLKLKSKRAYDRL